MNKLISILVLLFTFTVFADVKISDYKNYTITKTNFQLEEVSKGLNYPWGMTFIDDNNIVDKAMENILENREVVITHKLTKVKSKLHYGPGPGKASENKVQAELEVILF